MQLTTYACSLILLYSDNGIDAEGARALTESLKKNTTLIELNLGCMLKQLFVAER